jgi:hypothetical protein
MLHTPALSTRFCYQRDKRAKSGNLPKSNAISEIGERLIEKYFHLVFKRLFAVHCEYLSVEHTKTLYGPIAEITNVNTRMKDTLAAMPRRVKFNN